MKKWIIGTIAILLIAAFLTGLMVGRYMAKEQEWVIVNEKGI